MDISLIPRSAVAIGSDATQSASRSGCNVQSDGFGRMREQSASRKPIQRYNGDSKPPQSPVIAIV